MIENAVKLVVWDLDDTFWRGTLLEGGVAPIEANCETVIELSRRGIINSICSKNDSSAVKAKLTELGVWDYFVFPAISFNPKGKAIAEMIEGAALRAENVLFVDDNPSNLEEAKFFNPGIMAARPKDVLETLLDHPHCIGKPDPELTRLNQYRFLQKKVEERATTDLSNEEFLRASNIRVTIDYDIEANFDRVIELINRTNQLNYTKKRLETQEAVEEFRSLLTETYAYHAGCVRAVDNYGDYGIVGFFLMRRKARKKYLIHFAFSCRAMNMGIEQYVYEQLGRPDIEIAGPVSYGLEPHASVDWINAAASDAEEGVAASNRRLVLLGACELLQLSSYCSTRRVEFVNGCKNDVMVVYTDPGFVLNDRTVVRESETLRRLNYWSHEDAVNFDEGIASAEIVLLSLWAVMQGKYFRTSDGVELRLANRMQLDLVKRDQQWFADNLKALAYGEDDRLSLLIRVFDRIGELAPASCRVFVLGANTHVRTEEGGKERKDRFNDTCRGYCRANSDRFRYVDLAAVIPAAEVVGRSHFSRKGYFILARHIQSLAGEPAPGVPGKPEDQEMSAA